MNKEETNFGIVPVVSLEVGSDEPKRTSGQIVVQWYDEAPVVTLQVKEGEPLIVEIGEYEVDSHQFNSRCGDSNHDYYFTLPPSVARVLG